MEIGPSQNRSDPQMLSALPAFEAAARRGSLTRAARELGVTVGNCSGAVGQLAANPRGAMLDWEDLKTFLAIARERTLSVASGR